MDTQKYRVLKAVIELGSFSKAADALGYTQSAVSQTIGALEQELGFTLVRRSRRGVSLTPEGAELMPLIERVVMDQLRIEEKASEINGLERGVVRMGTLSSVSTHWLPAVIRLFKERYPHVEFVIHQGDYELIPQWIAEGIIDFGFVNPRAVKSLEVHELKDGEMLAVLPEGHPLAAKEVVPLEQLALEPFILLEEGNYYEPLEAFATVELHPRVEYTIHDDYAIMAMVEAGLGVSMLASLILRRTNYHIVCRPTDPPVTRTLAVAYKDGNALPVASRRFIDMLVEQVAQLP